MIDKRRAKQGEKTLETIKLEKPCDVCGGDGRYLMDTCPICDGTGFELTPLGARIVALISRRFGLRR